MADIYLTKKELAEVAGYTYRRLHDIDMSMKNDEKLFVKGEGGYSLCLFVQRWVKYQISHEKEGEESLEKVKARHEEEKIKKTVLEVQRMRGELVDVAEVKKLWGDIAASVSQNLLRLPGVLAPQLLEMDSAARITEIIDGEIRRTLNDIADAPLPAYAEAMQEDDETEE